MRCHSPLQGSSWHQGSNPDLLNCSQILYHLSHLGSPKRREDALKTQELKTHVWTCNLEQPRRYMHLLSEWEPCVEGVLQWWTWQRWSWRGRISLGKLTCSSWGQRGGGRGCGSEEKTGSEVRRSSWLGQGWSLAWWVSYTQQGRAWKLSFPEDITRMMIWRQLWTLKFHANTWSWDFVPLSACLCSILLRTVNSS